MVVIIAHVSTDILRDMLNSPATERNDNVSMADVPAHKN